MIFWLSEGWWDMFSRSLEGQWKWNTLLGMVVGSVFDGRVVRSSKAHRWISNLSGDLQWMSPCPFKHHYTGTVYSHHVPPFLGDVHPHPHLGRFTRNSSFSNQSESRHIFRSSCHLEGCFSPQQPQQTSGWCELPLNVVYRLSFIVSSFFDVLSF